MSLQGVSLLLVEDDPLLRRHTASVIEAQGAEVTAVVDLRGARASVAMMDYDFVLLDLNLPDGSGLDLLQEQVFPPGTGVIILTANSNVQHAVEALRSGAIDYLVKPFNPAELPLVLCRARQARQAHRREEHQRAADAAAVFFFGDSLTGLREQLDRILAADRRVEGPPPPVLIEGETGTGKTTVARWLHHHGPRAQGPLVEVNCSALPEALAESELFGHERGAFTDARSARMGLFEAAGGGTLFLDEVPSLPLPLQAKVLTAIEDHQVRRVGGRKPIAVDVRLITASNRDLREAVARGAFREDLFHRLDLLRLRLSPLRERGPDVVRLAHDLLSRLCRKHRLPARSISASGERQLLTYPWPGNVRELAHELERALVFEEGTRLEFRHLASAAVTGVEPAATLSMDTDWFNERFVFPDEGFHIEAAVLRIIHHALRQTAGNRSAAARLLGVPRDYLRYRLEKHEGQGETAGGTL